MTVRYRVAGLADIPAMIVIRGAVRENPLVTLRIEHADYVQAQTIDGRAWVAEQGGVVVGFACGRRRQGDVWALFLDPAHQGRGVGGALMDLVEGWLFAQGLDRIELTTAPGTRAERLYRKRGWTCHGLIGGGAELRFTLARPG